MEESVKPSIKALVEELLGEEVLAITIYGSRVAGYAKPDSDYDVIAVARRFRDPVRYFYFEKPVKSSVLVVREKELLDDAAQARLGEFVVGRLLNVHEVVFDPGGVIGRAEAVYRRRVVEEEFQELVFEFGQFSTQILAPPEYFLFSKLRRRAMVYPPAYYSYYYTYSGPRGGENTRWSAKRFNAVLSEMARRGEVRRVGGRYSPTPAYLKKLLGGYRHPLLPIVGRAIRQYLTHFSSGKVGPRVFIDELTSKITRSRGLEARLSVLDNPRCLLSLPEGVFSTSGLEPLVKGSLRYEAKPLGDIYSTAKLLRVYSNGPPRGYIVKEYVSPWALKWLVARVASAGVREFLVSPTDRLATEYRFTRLLRATGFKTPRITLVDPGRALVVRQFVEGETLASMLGDPGRDWVFRRLGALLANLHKRYLITLGDAKLSNFLLSGGDLYVLDCEQARFGGDPGWDLAFMLYFSMFEGRGKSLLGVRRSLVELVKGYKSVYEELRVGGQLASKMDYIFRPLLQPREIKLAGSLLAFFMAGGSD